MASLKYLISTMVFIGELDLFQHTFKKIPFSMKICHTVDHLPPSFHVEWNNRILP